MLKVNLLIGTFDKYFHRIEVFDLPLLKRSLIFIHEFCNTETKRLNRQVTKMEKRKLKQRLRNKVCLDSNVLSKESAKLLVTEEEIENDKDKSFLDERFRNSFGKYFGSHQVHFVEKS